MKYNQPYGVSDPTAPYINGNPSTGTMGSIPPAASIEHPQREIVELIADSGLTPTETDLKQLAKGIQSGRINFGVDAGTVNNLQVTLAPVPVLKNGLVVRVLAVQNNTGPAVLNVNALGPKKIRRPADTDLLANDISTGGIVTLVYNEGLQAGAGAFELQGAQSGSTGYMAGNMDLYVNFATGSDSNDGTAADAAHALKNIQRAVDIAFSYRPSQYLLTIHVADSPSYVDWRTPGWQGPRMLVVGNTATPANVLVTARDALRHSVTIVGVNIVEVKGMKVATPTGDPNHQNYGFAAYNSAQLTLTNCEAGYCDGGPVYSGLGANVAMAGFFRFGGNTAGAMLTCAQSGQLTAYGCSMVIVSGLVGPVFAKCSYGFMQINAGTCPFSGSGMTGTRYAADQNGIIQTLGGGANYFPGTVAGTVGTGGQYS